ncbi:hypothetical protein P7C70_g80, partial [Phenoliferia sp. Uapishka_3]
MPANAILPPTHKGVVQTAPFTIEVQDVATPTIEEESDVIVKVLVSALCGSDLHIYRGHQKPPYGAKLPGAQAADSTLFIAPEDIADKNLVLMADIIPTGLFAAKSAWNMLNEEERVDSSCCVIGCGPVGLCAITAAKQRFKTVYAIDGVPERLVLAKAHGAIPLNLNENPLETISKLIGGGTDAVLELVGSPDAVLLAIELARIGGVVISAGVHTHSIEMPAQHLYNKNLRFQFGRCPARALFKEALELLRTVSKQSDVFDGFVEAIVPLSQAPEYYKKFNDRLVGKTVFIQG